ncbi:hypothetical protein [Rhizobium indigoferae]|uniref:Uncharacterized protein n=1 Tax=Rhizobium indigoferae TaxID=158891 RepID=A0ABZ1DML6_9HYPH|nr:hypothetical protein [Rhizobium indigoferae]NNU58173.1 hypothetical protein [Rhizobium indigoferae]WRW37496.1 hypothetical protein U5G49_007071 [Rhizobium indigoferae]GLR62006.1 hypothetical protein GCM10007919_67360 [Rhizobium indigoferae]
MAAQLIDRRRRLLLNLDPIDCFLKNESEALSPDAHSVHPGRSKGFCHLDGDAWSSAAKILEQRLYGLFRNQVDSSRISAT